MNQLAQAKRSTPQGISLEERSALTAGRCAWSVRKNRYEEEYQVTEGTVYKNGSWAKMQKGVHVRIAGHSYSAIFVEFTK